MNWSQYNTNLTNRGNINLWIAEDVNSWWLSINRKKRGRPFVYSDKAVETCLTIRYLFRLPLRMTEGFINSLFQREGILLKAPCYTQLSRRMLKIELPKIKIRRGEQVNLAFDSTGLKVYGEGEWKVRTHGASKRRAWRKLHIAVNVETLCITRSALTNHSTTDAEIAKSILSKECDGAIQSILGDGAYDKSCVYREARRINAKTIIPPAHNARIQKKIIDPAKIDRDHIIAKIQMLGGDEEARKRWKKESGYYRRSLAETTMYRFKTAFSDRLQHRSFKNQVVEAALKIEILNTFTSLGLPRNT